MHVRRSDAMDQTGLVIGSNVQFHVEVPRVAFFGLVHLRVPAVLLILGRGRYNYQRGIPNRFVVYAGVAHVDSAINYWLLQRPG